MITHNVIFSWHFGVSSDQIEGLRQALNQMVEEISADMTAEQAGVFSISHGPDLRFRDGNGDYALVATFIDRAAWDAYQADPRHKAFVRDFVTPLAATRFAIQF